MVSPSAGNMPWIGRRLGKRRKKVIEKADGQRCSLLALVAAHRRRQRKGYADLLQHDSSPHPWWPGDKLQGLALTIDDATRFMVGSGFIKAETTFAHLAHVRYIFLAHGGLGVSRLVAKDPRSKGKTERQFGFRQKRRPALFALESVATRAPANELPAAQIDWHHHNHVSRSTGLTPHQAVEKSISAGSACWRPAPPPELLDLHPAPPHPDRPESRGDQLPGPPLGDHSRRDQAGDHRPTAGQLQDHRPAAHPPTTAVARHPRGIPALGRPEDAELPSTLVSP